METKLNIPCYVFALKVDLYRCPCLGLGCESFHQVRSGPRLVADAGNLANLRSDPGGPCRQGESGHQCRMNCCHWSAVDWVCCQSAVHDAPVEDLGAPSAWRTQDCSFLYTGETLHLGLWSADVWVWRPPSLIHSLPLPPPASASPPQGSRR